MLLNKVILAHEFAFRQWFPTDQSDGDSSLVRVNLERFVNFPSTTKIHAYCYKVERRITDVSDFTREWYEGSTLVGIKNGMAAMVDESIDLDSVTHDGSWTANPNYKFVFHGINNNCDMQYKHYCSDGPAEFDNIYLCTEIESVGIYDNYDYIIYSESSHVLEFPPTNALVIKADRIIYQ